MTRVFCSAAAAAAAIAAVFGAAPAVFAQATATATPSPGATVPNSIGYSFTYTVNAGAGSDPAATPAPNGATFKTLERALSDAITRKNAGSNVVVNVRPGTYYENVSMPAASSVGDDTAWLTIQRASGFSGPVIVSGATKELPNNSDWNSGWTSVGNGVWRHVWPYDYTLSPIPGYYDGGPNLADTARHGAKVPLTRRKELIFVGNTMLRQVGSTNSTGSAAPPASVMVDGSFHVNVNTTATDSEGRQTNPPAAAPNNYVFINPPGNTNPNGASVEVALRPSAMSVNRRRNVILRGLDFARTTGYQTGNTEGYGLSIGGGCVNVLVEDCNAYYNNNVGMRLSGEAITVRGSDASDNGVKGMFGSYVFNVRTLDSSTNRNNFRGDWAGYISGAAPSGFKFMHTRGTTWIRHTANDNFSRGMWWDSDCTNIYAESCFMSGNRWSGMFVEYVQGPTLVKRSIIKDTVLSGDDETPQFTGGLLLSTCTDVTLQSNIVYNNASWQLRILNTAIRGDDTNLDTDEPLRLAPRRFSFKNNVLLGAGTGQIALTFPPDGPATSPGSDNYPFSGIYDTMDSGLTAASSGPNCFWNASRSDLFGTTADETYALTTRLLEAWRPYAGQEWASIQQQPGFASPSANDFRLTLMMNGQRNPLLDWNLPTAPLD